MGGRGKELKGGVQEFENVAMRRRRLGCRELLRIARVGRVLVSGAGCGGRLIRARRAMRMRVIMGLMGPGVVQVGLHALLEPGRIGLKLLK